VSGKIETFDKRQRTPNLAKNLTITDT